MPRRKLTDPPIEIHISIPTSLLTQVDQELIDPMRGKPRYAARSHLIRRLLIEWLEVANAARKGEEL